MHAHRVEILDRADNDAVVVLVTNDLHLELFPADHRLLEQNLGSGRHFEAVRDDALEFLAVVGDAAARTAERERRPDNGREPDVLLLLERFFERMRDERTRALEADFGHCLAKQVTILGHVDRLAFRRDHLDVKLLENALAREVERAIQAGLPAHGGQQRIRTLLLDDARQRGPVNRLDVDRVRHLGIRHDRGRVRIDENDAEAFFTKCLARLRARIVELTRLADHDRAGADNQDAVYVAAFGHRVYLLFTLSLFFK